MKIGDKVRFLNDIGGGKIVAVKPNGIVVVEDEDGFEIPMQARDVALIQSDNYETSRIVEGKKKADAAAQSFHDGNKSIKSLLQEGTEEAADVEAGEDYDPSEMEITFKAPVEERKGGDKLSAYLVFVPIDAKELTNTRFEAYFVNDSNYYINYSYLSAEGNSWKLRKTSIIEPNTKEFIEEFRRESLDEIAHVAIQAFAYKQDKNFLIKPAIDVQFRIDGVKFYKLHVFQENDFFDQPALMYTIVENDEMARPLVINAKALKEEMYKRNDDREQKQPARKEKAKGKDTGEIVVDLHADALLDTTDGMQPIDILNYQLTKFRETLNENADKKGQRIIFIHGKGEGVLRNAIINDLRYRYKKYTYQDASFQEYGYGATQVTIK